MELRGCSQVHFMSVIWDGEVIKMHNIARGKSVLKFKNIEEIYASDGSNDQESLSRHPPKVDRSLASPYGVDEEKTEVKTECMEEETDLDFGKITLKQLRKTCKSKKRKAPLSVKLAAVKLEDSNLPCEEDELELKETLISWKRKVLKKSKTKKKKKSKRCSLSSETSNSGSISEDDTSPSLALIDISSEMYKPLQVKVEDPEPEFVQPQALSFILSDEYGSSTSEMAETFEFYQSDQDLETDLGDLQRGHLTQASQEYAVQPNSVDTSECALNEISYELIDQMGHNLINPESSNFEEIMMIEGPKVIDQSSVCSGSEFQKEEDMPDPMTCDDSPERVLSVWHPIVFHDSCSHSDDNKLPTANGVASLNKLTPVIDEKYSLVADFTCAELQAGNCQNGGIEEESFVRSHIGDSTGQYNKILPSANYVTSIPNTSFVNEDKCSSVDDHIASLSSSAIQPNTVSEELTGSATSKGDEDSVMPRHPERLFSARKIISPTSQERLRKAMNVDEQDDVETHSCKEKLQFEESEIRFSNQRPGVKRARFVCSSEKPEIVNTTRIRIKSRHRMTKSIDERKVSHSRCAVKGTQGSPTSQSVSNIFSSVQMCSQNAIAFSQRQVHDIQRLATKLVEGLQSMKSIVVDAMQHESRTGSKSRYNTNQARLAVESVGKLEMTTQRWLAIMSRDCDRFCKIMSVAEADASPEKPKTENLSPPTKTAPKERKIMFADEAGESLCKVKVFKKFETDMDVDTPLTSQCSKG